MLRKILASVLLVAILVAMIFACGGEQEQSSKTASKKTASVDGKKLYQKNCVVCHGIYGDMGASGAHNLTESTLSTEDRIAVIADGRNVMTPFKDVLTEEEIAAVAAYSATLKQ